MIKLLDVSPVRREPFRLWCDGHLVFEFLSGPQAVSYSYIAVESPSYWSEGPDPAFLKFASETETGVLVRCECVTISKFHVKPSNMPNDIRAGGPIVELPLKKNRYTKVISRPSIFVGDGFFEVILDRQREPVSGVRDNQVVYYLDEPGVIFGFRVTEVPSGTLVAITEAIKRHEGGAVH